MYKASFVRPLSARLYGTLILAILLSVVPDSFGQQETGSSSQSTTAPGSASPGMFSSSDAGPSALPTLFADETGSQAQPPQRRRYGRPNYTDSSHNGDGSNRWTFAAGAGFTAPVGITHKYLTPSYDLQLAGGRNFNKTYGLLLGFDFHNFGMQQQALNNQLAVYQAYDPSAGFTSLSGSSHVWSFSLDPIINY